MSTLNDDQVEEQTTLEESQAEERKQLQEEQNKETDAERVRLQDESNRAHTESDIAQDEALKKEDEERITNAKLNH